MSQKNSRDTPMSMITPVFCVNFIKDQIIKKKKFDARMNMKNFNKGER
jgi:hypothetical protein